MSGIGFSVADDPASDQVVLFGGVDNYANTWVWSGHWILAAPEISPSGRIDAAAAYDPITQQVLLFGGRQAPVTTGALLHDTWAWNGASLARARRTDRAVLRRARARRWHGMTRSTRWCWSPRPVTRPAATRRGSGLARIGCSRSHGGVAPSAFDLPMAFDPVTQSLIAEGCCYAPNRGWARLTRHGAGMGSGGTSSPGRHSRSRVPTSHSTLIPARLALCNCGPTLSLPVLASWTGHTWDAHERRHASRSSRTSCSAMRRPVSFSSSAR